VRLQTPDYRRPVAKVENPRKQELAGNQGEPVIFRGHTDGHAINLYHSQANVIANRA
jgi:hypothetical protein